jgi:flagellar biosynthesis protein FliR
MDDAAGLLHELPSLAFGFILVVARVGTTLLTGPGLGDAEIPPTVRIALAVVLAALAYPVLRAGLPPLPDTVTALIGLLSVEFIVGAWLGLLTNVLVMALSMAGSIISYMIGLSSVLQLDPSIGNQVPALERALTLAAITLLFVSGLYVLPVRAVIGSYQVVPPGAAFDAGGAAQLATRAVADSFALALRLAAPFIVICIVWQAALGFVSRLVPNIQVHLVSQPAQILAGLMLLAAAIAVMFNTWLAGMLQAFSVLPGL